MISRCCWVITKPGHCRAGHVAFIPGTPDFYIALIDHADWSTSHTVFAEVKDFVIVDLIAVQWTHEFLHPQYGVPMQMMNVPVEFQIVASL